MATFFGGGAGDDWLDGGDGDDILVGGPRKDMLFGAFGADTFRFLKDDIGFQFGGPDVIIDFNRSQGDKTDLTGTNVSYFGGLLDVLPEPGEVNYWFSGSHTYISFNDDGIHDIELEYLRLDLVADDFLLSSFPSDFGAANSTAFSIGRRRPILIGLDTAHTPMATAHAGV